MRKVLDAFRSLTRWQVALMVFVLIAAFGVTLGGYYLATGSDETELGENQLLIPVRLGDLINEVSISGSLVYPNRETLSFGAEGVVAEILVGEGDTVQEGQPLARLDDESVAALERAVAQARIDLRDAEDALEETKAPPTALDVAKAEAAVSDARIALSQAQDALDALMGPTAFEVAKATAAVSGERLALANAEEALAETLAGASGDDIVAATSKVRSANANLDNAEIDLTLTRSDWDDKLEAARDASDAALEDLRSVYRKWFGVELSKEELSLGLEALLRSWDTDLESLFDPDSVSIYDYLREPPGTSGGYDRTPWNEHSLLAWLKLYPGTIVTTCDSPPRAGTRCVKMEIDDAWDAYVAKKDDLGLVETQADKAIGAAKESVTSSQEKLADAEKALAELMTAADELEVQNKEKEVDLAIAALDKAEEDLVELTAGPDPVELESARMQIVLKRATLEQAIEDREALEEKADDLDVALREAEIVTARAALDHAVEKLHAATLSAPWNGIVTSLEVDAGQEVKAGDAVVRIVDPNVVEMDGIVDQIDVLYVQKGATASITMDALLGQTLTGKVTSIATEPNTQQGVVSYPLRIQVNATEGLQLPEGLSATARAVIREERGVLLVPLQSLYGTFDQPAVRVKTADGRIEERPIKIGNSDDFYAVVVEGLKEGEMLVMESQDSIPQQFGFGRAVRSQTFVAPLR